MYVDLCSPNKTVIREMLNDMGANFIDLIKCMIVLYEKMTIKMHEGEREGKRVFSEVGIKKGCHHERDDSSVYG